MLTVLPIRDVADVEASRRFYAGLGLSYRTEVSVPAWAHLGAAAGAVGIHDAAVSKGGRPARSNSASRPMSDSKTCPRGSPPAVTSTPSSTRTSAAASASPTRTASSSRPSRSTPKPCAAHRHNSEPPPARKGISVEPVIALLGVTAVVFIVRRIRPGSPRGFEIALRAGVAAMFTLTGIAHFIGMRADLIAMVPDWLPAPGAVITITGILELAAAAAMLHRRLATLAAGGLTLLLIAMSPANVKLALSGAPLPWWDELVPRTVMQALFVAATITVLSLTRRPVSRTAASDSIAASPPERKSLVGVWLRDRSA